MSLEVLYQGADISRDIAPFLIDFTYTDNAHGKDDDISLVLEDRQGLWRGDWFPTRGDSVSVSMVSTNWGSADEMEVFPCGSFQVDEIECSGPPSRVTLKAVSTPVSSSAKRKKETKAWEGISLSEVAKEIAGRHSLTLTWDVSDDPFYERKDQVETPDLAFLRSLCEDAGLAIKTTDSQLVVFAEQEYEKKPPVADIVYGESLVTSFRFRAKTAGAYKAARVQYHDPKKAETFEVYSSEGKTMGTSEVLEINQRVESEAAARKLAEKRLYEANKREMSGSIVAMGNFSYLGGSTVKIRGFGNFDGVYFIERASHRVSKDGGYVSSIDIRSGGGASSEH